uniref:Uncharacterized protein n=2 Tax=Vibrionaceae TaxID=641 RepID=A0A0H4A366_VIBSP|nr:hypothetical protein [Enterovibrio norvegicus]AKN40679.1 hypothetical protein [Vibrio splendidus]
MNELLTNGLNNLISSKMRLPDRHRIEKVACTDCDGHKG